jgi:NADPH:quinone reductase-like Zn-dependent oxidoreductase
MKAIVFRSYGSPDDLRYEDVEKPTAGGDEVLVRVMAASVNPLDGVVRGTPYIIRLATGLPRPKDTRLGRDVAGRVEAVGRNVTQFKPGDEVFGVCRGAFADHACASESNLVMKPVNLTFEQAAAVPVAALTALQGLRDKGQIQRGQKVLINGSAGGVGTFAVQIAKSFGTHVTAVCSTRNVEMVRSIGADRVIDYTQDDFTRSGQRYDLIFDLVANHSLLACRRVLNPNGVHVAAGAVGVPNKVSVFLARAVISPVLSRFVSQKFVVFITKMRKEDLTIMCDLVKTRTVTPVIDRRYGLREVSQAIRYLEEGHARGKVVITVSDSLTTSQ